MLGSVGGRMSEVIVSTGFITAKVKAVGSKPRCTTGESESESERDCSLRFFFFNVSSSKSPNIIHVTFMIQFNHSVGITGRFPVYADLPPLGGCNHQSSQHNDSQRSSLTTRLASNKVT